MKKLRLALLFLLVPFLVACQSATLLRAPSGYYHQKAAMTMSYAVTQRCEAIPDAYKGTLIFNSKYEGSGKARDELNEDANQRYLTATESIRAYEKLVVTTSDQMLMAHGATYVAYRRCLIDSLYAWAASDALLAGEVNGTGKAVRKWALSAISSAYLKAKLSIGDVDNPDLHKIQIIEDWLTKLAEHVVQDYRDRPLEKANNHDYWAGWAVMITSIATNRQDLFQWSRAKLEQGLDQINEKGFLPNELKRKTRALSYHNFAIKPLMMMAAFAEINGAQLGFERRKRLKMLANVVLEGIKDTSSFEALTEARQETKGLKKHHSLAWLEPYSVIYQPTPDIQALVAEMRPMRSTRMGGDLSFLFGRTHKD